jgi:vacuolar-type H+-ATPase subunit E/Vma4
MATKYSIEFKGQDTAKEIVKELRLIADAIEENIGAEHEAAILDGAEWSEDNFITMIQCI